MTDDNQTTTDLTIPDETREQFSELTEMIIGSQSMNDEERQYWIDVLPIMTEDQTDNLRGILDNEKGQTEEADKEYEKDIEKEVKKASIDFDEFRYKEKKRIRQEAEHMFEKEEHEHEASLLEEISNM